MTNARPALGYPSRSAACLALRDQGLSPKAIADRFAQAGEAISTHQISGLLSRCNRSKGARLTLPRTLVERLSPAADARGVTPGQLTERLLATVVEANLIDAVLDDRDEISPKKEV